MCSLPSRANCSARTADTQGKYNAPNLIPASSSRRHKPWVGKIIEPRETRPRYDFPDITTPFERHANRHDSWRSVNKTRRQMLSVWCGAPKSIAARTASPVEQSLSVALCPGSSEHSGESCRCWRPKTPVDYAAQPEHTYTGEPRTRALSEVKRSSLSGAHDVS